MQRIARYALIAVALTAGCQDAGPRPSARLPEPLIRTRQPAPPQPPPPVATPAPSRPLAPAPKPAPPPVAAGLNTAELTPPGGIQRGRWKVIVVHHSATANDTPASMDHYHRNVRKWSGGLGYHFVIGNGNGFPDGKVFVGNRWKKQDTGAHCKSDAGRYFGVYRANNFFNENGIGICLIGNFEGASPSPRQLAALKELIQFLCKQTGVKPTLVYGHGEVTHKTACPGRSLSSKLAGVKQSVAQALVIAPPPLPAPLAMLGLNQYLAALAQPDVHNAGLCAGTLAECGQVCDALRIDGLDDVADPYAAAVARAVFHHVHDQDAAFGDPLRRPAGSFGEVRQAQPAP